MQKVVLLVLSCSFLLLTGCAKRPSAEEAYLERITRINAVYYAEDIEDDEPCCAPLDEWMPKLFAPKPHPGHVADATFPPQF